MDVIDEEILAIQAIFCEGNEVTLLEKGCSETVIAIEAKTKCLKKLTITVTLKPFKYPTEVPPFSLKCLDLSRSQCESVKEMLTEAIKPFEGEPMLFQMISCINQLNLSALTYDPICITNVESFTAETCLLQLDHIRNKERYVKAVKRWVNHLKLDGRLIFCKHIILILLQGSKENIKEYILKNKTENVDVDCRGKPCKERLLTVLEMSPGLPQIPSGFSIVTLTNLEDLNTYFDSIRLNGFKTLFESLNKRR